MPEARPQLCGVEPDRFRRLVLIGVVLNRIGDPLPEVHPRRGVVPDWDSHWNILIANTKNGTKGAFVHHDAFGSVICTVAALACLIASLWVMQASTPLSTVCHPPTRITRIPDRDGTLAVRWGATYDCLMEKGYTVDRSHRTASVPAAQWL